MQAVTYKHQLRQHAEQIRGINSSNVNSHGPAWPGGKLQPRQGLAGLPPLHCHLLLLPAGQPYMCQVDVLHVDCFMQVREQAGCVSSWPLETPLDRRTAERAEDAWQLS